jgi:hypothetical protein
MGQGTKVDIHIRIHERKFKCLVDGFTELGVFDHLEEARVFAEQYAKDMKQSEGSEGVVLYMVGDSTAQFFSYSHLPKHLQEVSKQFSLIAEWILLNLPPNVERAAALRSLLITKDAAVRAVIFK